MLYFRYCFINKKGGGMLKKILLLSTVTALMFWGCGSENTTSPVHEGQPKSNQSDPDSLKNNANDKKDSTKNSTGNNVACTYEVLSDTSIVSVLKQVGVTTKVTVTIKGAVQEIEYYSTYADTVSSAYIQSVCEENKETAAAEHRNATVTCDERTMTIKETVPSVSIEFLEQNAKSECEKFNGKFANSDATPDRANCTLRSTETALKMEISVPDSMNLVYDAQYKDGVFTTTSEVTFAQNVSKSDVQDFCDQAKVNSIEYSTNGETRQTTCKDRHIVTVETKKSSVNPLEELTPQFESFCNKVVETGTY